jgi:HlyD family secretion protein
MAGFARLSLLLAALVSLGACGDEAAAARAQPAQKKAAPREVRLLSVGTRSMARTVVVQGVLAPDEEVVVSTRVAGHLSSLAVDLGSVVAKDQVIAQLESQDFRLRVEQARAALAQARASLGLEPDAPATDIDLEQTSAVREARATLDQASSNTQRAQQLRDRKLIAPAEFDTTNTAELRAEAALETAREDVRSRQAMVRQRASELALAQKQLADTTIRAPMDGVVSARTASAGEFLQAASPVVTIVRINPLRLRVDIPERDAQAVQVGQAVDMTVDGQEGSLQGKIARVSPAISAQSRTLAVEAMVDNPGGLRAGSFARGTIVVSHGNVLAVPVTALVSFAGIHKVLTVEDGKAVEKQVKTGRTADGFVEVLEGVEADERVIDDPKNLQQGDPVVVGP